MRILLASEELTNRPREGSLVFLMHLGRFLHEEGELTALHAVGEVDPYIRSHKALSSKTMISRKLLRIARKERFDAVIYVPRSGLTAFGLARGALLRFLLKAPTIVIGLQAREIGGLHRIVSFLATPDLVMTPVEDVREKLEGLGINTAPIVPGYDKRLFRPVSPDVKAKLRARHNLPLERCIVLHVGHIRESRNLEVFLRYRDWGPDIQPVIKAGEIDPSWARRLRMAGIIVIDEYFPEVHELYQAADCYLFPVNSPLGAVSFPLSVIEACACNLPVLTTRFGALPEAIREGGGFHYYDRISEIAGKIAEMRGSKPATAAKVESFAWETIFNTQLLPHLQALAKASKGEGAP